MCGPLPVLLNEFHRPSRASWPATPVLGRTTIPTIHNCVRSLAGAMAGCIHKAFAGALCAPCWLEAVAAGDIGHAQAGLSLSTRILRVPRVTSGCKLIHARCVQFVAQIRKPLILWWINFDAVNTILHVVSGLPIICATKPGQCLLFVSKACGICRIRIRLSLFTVPL